MELKGHTIGFKGEYSATVLKADGTVKEFLNEEKTLRSGDIINNMLLDGFFSMLHSRFSLDGNGAQIRIGTGTAPVLANQTALSNQINVYSVNTGNNPNVVASNGKLIGTKTYTFTFSLGAISANISELGIDFLRTDTGIIHSRALVVDSGGKPTTITVTSSEQLILTYSLRMEMPDEDVITETSMVLNGVATPVTVTSRWSALRPFEQYLQSLSGTYATAYSGALNSRGVAPSGVDAIGGTFSYQLNQNNGKNTIVSFAANELNLQGGAGIASFIPGNNHNVVITKFGFNPPIPKNADRTLSITIRQTFGRLP